MSSFETPHDTGRGFGLTTRDAQVIGGASGLMAVTIALMYVIVETPLAAVNDVLFQAPIVGVLVYGVAIVGTELVAERGIETGNWGLAALGTAILLFVFGLFGGGVLRFAPRADHLTIVGITAIVTAVITALIAGYVYARTTDFDHWGTYANYAFVGGVGAVLVGTFVAPVLLVGFVLIFLGFLLRLGWEIWRVREQRSMPVAMQTIGVYVAVAGVFVHVLQLVLRYVASE